jgi:tetratricopeptide (TPR) repeat protein
LLERDQVHDLQSYELYLQARSLLRRFGNLVFNVDSTRPTAIRLLEQAIARDPKFAPAYALLSEAQSAPGFGNVRTADLMERAKQSAETAVRLDPQLAEGHLMLGTCYVYFNQKERGLEEWKTAERLAPSNPAVLARLADEAIESGDWKNALDTLKRARQVEALEPTWANQLASLLMQFRHYDQAERLCDEMIGNLAEINPPEFWILKRNIALARSDLAGAVSAVVKSHELERGCVNVYYYLAELSLLQHRYAEAAQSLDRFQERASNTVTSPGGLKNLNENSVLLGRVKLLLGIARRALQGPEKARAAFNAAEQLLRKAVFPKPENPDASVC